LVVFRKHVHVVVGLRVHGLGGGVTVNVAGGHQPDFGSLVSVGRLGQVCVAGDEARLSKKKEKERIERC
jgi:hypothetical protein